MTEWGDCPEPRSLRASALADVTDRSARGVTELKRLDTARR